MIDYIREDVSGTLILELIYYITQESLPFGKRTLQMYHYRTSDIPLLQHGRAVAGKKKVLGFRKLKAGTPVLNLLILCSTTDLPFDPGRVA